MGRECSEIFSFTVVLQRRTQDIWGAGAKKKNEKGQQMGNRPEKVVLHLTQESTSPRLFHWKGTLESTLSSRVQEPTAMLAALWGCIGRAVLLEEC